MAVPRKPNLVLFLSVRCSLGLANLSTLQVQVAGNDDSPLGARTMSLLAPSVGPVRIRSPSLASSSRYWTEHVVHRNPELHTSSMRVPPKQEYGGMWLLFIFSITWSASAAKRAVFSSAPPWRSHLGRCRKQQETFQLSYSASQVVEPLRKPPSVAYAPFSRP
jgi:hypothetical protein